MRYAEITALPAPPEEADSSIINMITMASSKNKSEIPMQEILGMLRKEGYDLTPRMVMDVLKKTKLVRRTTKDMVHLVNDDADADPGMIPPDQEKEKAKKHVEKMAKQTIKKDSRKP
jgi:hypothetical protein